jgi:outer membrane protein OmpA-like peptidoglycan-associated protein
MRGKNEPEPSKRPLIVPELKGLPTFNVAIQFDVDTPIILPESYETVGRIADAFVNAPLLPYTFLIVGHTDSNGRREANVILSQRRADAIRDVLVNTFKISAKRIQSLGLGEEQFIDQAHPTSPVNLQIQIVTIGKVPETEPPATGAATPAAKKSAKKKK